jgi:hypothetical protein
MGQAGWIHAQSMSWQRQAEQITKWYEEVIARSRINGQRTYAAL